MSREERNEKCFALLLHVCYFFYANILIKTINYKFIYKNKKKWFSIFSF